MPQESCHREVEDVLRFLIAEDENFVGRALNGMVCKEILQQFETDFGLQLLLEHTMEYEVEDGEHGRDFFIAVMMFLAEHVVHVVEVELE